MNKIELIHPTNAMKQQAIAFKQEFFDHGETVIDGSDLWDQIDTYEDWLMALKRNEAVETCDPNWVVSHTWFGIKDGEIVGIIDLRPSLNAQLSQIGHIGYSVRPSQRRCGIAKEMLAQVLEIAKQMGLSQVTLSCFHDSVASAHTIKSQKGTLAGHFTYQGRDADLYHIDL